MSSCSESEENQKNSVKLALQQVPLNDLQKLERPDLIAYIEKLHKIVQNQHKKLNKYREKLSNLQRQQQLQSDAQKSESTNENVDENVKKAQENGKDEEEEASNATAAFSFVDEMRQAAEQAQNLNGLVYEPTSGLYYDQATGYYYNAEYGLYYDGNTGCYYKYDQQKKSYEFHSQVQVQPTQEAKNAGSSDDDDNDMVMFDEFGGVITDKSKLRQLRKEQEKSKMVEKERRSKHKKKKSKKEDSKDDKHRHKHKHSSKRSHKHSKHKSKKSKRRSQSVDDDNAENDSGGKHASKKSKHCKTDDFEDGELSTSSSSESSSDNETDSSRGADGGQDANEDSSVTVFHKGSRFQDIAKKYPPSLRIIVQETNLENLKVGSLSLITFKGGSLGREGNHDVIIPDVNVSKCHLQFNYDTKNAIYKCIDMGSRNGTILNGVRISVAKSESEAHDMVHGSVLQIGQTKLLCHVHEGNSTCGLCEPGLLIENPVAELTTANSMVALSHKEQLKKLQKKYGLENEKFVDGKQSSGNYNDRAATRRTKIGSSTDKEKTQMASVDTAIPSENKGFKMLSKLGWSKGEALGKTNASSGLLEPINVSSNEGKKGFGCDDPTAGLILTAAGKKKLQTWQKAQERYRQSDLNVVEGGDGDDDVDNGDIT